MDKVLHQPSVQEVHKVHIQHFLRKEQPMTRAHHIYVHDEGRSACPTVCTLRTGPLYAYLFILRRQMGKPF